MNVNSNNCNSFDCVFNSDMDDLSSCVNYWIESLQIMDGGSLDATKLENLNFHATSFCELQKQILGTCNTTIFIGDSASIILHKYTNSSDDFKDPRSEYKEWLSN